MKKIFEGYYSFFCISCVLLQLISSSAKADVRMPAIFGDHMVLQQGISLPIWGEADPGEQVSVNFAGQSVSTKADIRGVWRVNLRPVPCTKTA